MSQKMRILSAVVLLVVIGAVVMGLEYFRGQSSLPAAGDVTLIPGSIPIYLDGQLAAGFAPASLENLEQASFVDAEEGKIQDGWLLRDVLLSYIPEKSLAPETQVIVSSSSRKKTAELIWAEVDAAENMVMFDLANKGTLKLVSLLERLDTRAEWIQDVDRIEVVSP